MPTPVSALTALNKLHTRVLEQASTYLRSQYYLIVTKCKFKMAARFSDVGLSKHMITLGLQDLNRAILGFEALQ
jgi:hypothetical protein